MTLRVDKPASDGQQNRDEAQPGPVRLATPDHAHERYSPKPPPKVSKFRTFENESVKIAEDVMLDGGPDAASAGERLEPEATRIPDPSRNAKTSLSVKKQAELLQKSERRGDRRRLLTAVGGGAALAVVAVGAYMLVAERAEPAPTATPRAPAIVAAPPPLPTASSANDGRGSANAVPTPAAAPSAEPTAARETPRASSPARTSAAPTPSAKPPQPWVEAGPPKPWITR